MLSLFLPVIANVDILEWNIEVLPKRFTTGVLNFKAFKMAIVGRKPDLILGNL